MHDGETTANSFKPFNSSNFGVFGFFPTLFSENDCTNQIWLPAQLIIYERWETILNFVLCLIKLAS